MDIVGTVLITLIFIGIVVGVVWLIIWALQEFGVPIPAQVVKIVWVIAVLVILLILWNSFGGFLPTMSRA